MTNDPYSGPAADPYDGTPGADPLGGPLPSGRRRAEPFDQETAEPYAGGGLYGGTPGDDDSGKADAAKSAAADTARTAQEEARGIAESAAESGRHLAAEAKEQGQKVTQEAKGQAEDLLRQGRDEITQQASEQQHRVAGGLRAFSEELDHMADAGDQGLAADLAHQLSAKVGAAAGWLDDREPGALLDEVRRFARNRPGTFLAIAAGAGVLAGRLTRGVKDAHSEDASSEASGAPGTTTGTYPARPTTTVPPTPSAPLTPATGGGGTPTTGGLGGTPTTGAYGTTGDAGTDADAYADTYGTRSTMGLGDSAGDPYGSGDQPTQVLGTPEGQGDHTSWSREEGDR